MKAIKYILFILMTYIGLVCHGQEVRLNLQECIDAALRDNLDLRSSNLEVAKSLDLQGSWLDLPQTSISLSQDPTSGGSPDNAVTFSQSFEFPTSYVAKRKYLKAETEVAKSNLNVSRNEVIRDVSSCYYTLLMAQRTVEILQKQDSVYSHFVYLADTRYKVGEISHLELINAQRAYNENKIELQKAVQSCVTAQLALGRLLNTDVSIVPSEPLAEITDNNIQEPFIFENTPTQGFLKAQMEASRRNLSVARQGFVPELSIGVNVQALIKGFNPYHIERERFEKGNFMGFEVGISVPLFFGAQRAKVKAAKRDIELNEVAMRQARQTMESQYQEAENELKRARQVLDYYKRQGVTEAAAMARLSQVEYDNGEIGYVEYIQNQQTALDIQLKYAGAINDYNQAILMLNYLKGNK